MRRKMKKKQHYIYLCFCLGKNIFKRWLKWVFPTFSMIRNNIFIMWGARNQKKGSFSLFFYFIHWPSWKSFWIFKTFYFIFYPFGNQVQNEIKKKTTKKALSYSFQCYQHCKYSKVTYPLLKFNDHQNVLFEKYLEIKMNNTA